MILDHTGNPITASTSVDPGLTGGWVRTSNGIERPTSISQLINQPISRTIERAAARLAYLTNPLVFGAVEILHGITLGDGITYGEHTDERVNTTWTEFWETNRLHDLTDRAFREYMTDGELLTLWPTNSRTLRRRRDQPARIGLYDVSMGWTHESIPGLPGEIQEVLTDSNHIHDDSQFVYVGHLAGMWNDPRGWPVIMQAVPAALAYVNFLNSRIRLHRVQSRINAIYKAFINPSWSADEQQRVLQQRAEAFSSIPADGSVITIGMDPTSGNSEGFDFPNYDKKSIDSSEDGRLLRMLFAVGLNLPLMLLSDGEDANLATSTVQMEGAIRGLKKRQRALWSWLQQLGRTELERRNGPAQLYEVARLRREGTRIVKDVERVPASMIELPVVLPEITAEDTQAVISKVQYARGEGWMSNQTGAGKLGIDLLQEMELLAAEGDEMAGRESVEEENNGI